jgi:hypothetical protein
MTPTILSTIAAAVLAGLFEYVPGLHTWYNALVDTKQRLVMLACLALIVGGAFGLSCTGWLSAWPCTQAGLKDAIYALVLAIAANQGTYLILPKLEEDEFPK